jgi:hypothetical protein
MDRAKQIELMTLLIRHVKGVLSTLEKYLEALKETK